MNDAGAPACPCVVVAGGGLLDIVLLHGYAMRPEDLQPFASALGLPARYFFPRAPLAAEPSGLAWWDRDQERRQAALRHGPRDLSGEYPEGRAAAHGALLAQLSYVLPVTSPRQLVLGGFSQGGMLAMDFFLERRPALAALILMSASRLALQEWSRRSAALAGLPVFVSHGRSDDELAFEAGAALCGFAEQAGALATWLPFDGGHTTPLPVWRALRKFLKNLG